VAAKRHQAFAGRGRETIAVSYVGRLPAVETAGSIPPPFQGERLSFHALRGMPHFGRSASRTSRRAANTGVPRGAWNENLTALLSGRASAAKRQRNRDRCFNICRMIIGFESLLKHADIFFSFTRNEAYMEFSSE